MMNLTIILPENIVQKLTIEAQNMGKSITEVIIDTLQANLGKRGSLSTPTNSYLTTEEILALAKKRSLHLHQLSRDIAVAQFKNLIEEIRNEARELGVTVEDIPDGD